jgi:hypothetical protein
MVASKATLLKPSLATDRLPSQNILTGSNSMVSNRLTTERRSPPKQRGTGPFANWHFTKARQRTEQEAKTRSTPFALPAATRFIARVQGSTKILLKNLSGTAAFRTTRERVMKNDHSS